MLVKLFDIEWDTDDETIDGLPSEIMVEVDDDFDAADWLSDHYGWCVNKVCFEVITN